MQVCVHLPPHPSIPATGQGQRHIKPTAEAGSNMAELSWDKAGSSRQPSSAKMTTFMLLNYFADLNKHKQPQRFRKLPP